MLTAIGLVGAATVLGAVDRGGDGGSGHTVTNLHPDGHGKFRHHVACGDAERDGGLIAGLNRLPELSVPNYLDKHIIANALTWILKNSAFWTVYRQTGSFVE